MKKSAAPTQKVFSIQKKTIPLVVGGTVCIALLTAGGVFVVTRNYYQNLLSQAHPIFVAGTPYKLLHPILGIALPNDQFNTNFPDIRTQVQSTVSALPADTVTRYALYFRDLDSGNWTGINQSDPFDPASLLKVIVAIAAYRQAEDHPGYLLSPLTYTSALAQVNAQLPFAQPTELQVGQSYSVPFLIKKELTDSDNGAVDLLLDSIDNQELDAVYGQLSIPRPDDDNSTGYTLTALEYSGFFRILYNGTLNIDWAHSEQILEDLSQSTFTSGLVAGVPDTVTVAHKYGEHVEGSNGVARSVELSDCGIVYYPSHPYFLCVMVQGKDPGTLAGVIAQISGVVYQKVAAAEG